MASSRPPLSAAQTRRLTEYLDEHLDNLNRQYHSRSNPSSDVRTLSQFLAKTNQLMGLVLAIPQKPSSAHLLVSYLLSMTGDLGERVVGYSFNEVLDDDSVQFELAPEDDTRSLAALEEILERLDDGWEQLVQEPKVMSQTDVIRLSSLITPLRSSIQTYLLAKSVPKTSLNEIEDIETEREKTPLSDGGPEELTFTALTEPGVAEVLLKTEDAIDQRLHHTFLPQR